MKFLRRTRHVASIVTLTLAFASCALAQSSRPSEGQQNDAAAKRDQERNDQLRSLATELNAIRIQQAETEQREAANETAQNDPFGPPTWPNWVLAALAAIAAFIAARTLKAVEHQAIETAKSANAARASIILTHRPKIVIRNVVSLPLEKGLQKGTLGGTLWATNTGNTPAVIVRFRAIWLTTDRLPMRNPILTHKSLKREIRVGAGRSVALKLPRRAVNAGETVIILGARKTAYPNHTLYLIGLVKYLDLDGQLRRTAFCRRWDQEAKRFKVVRDADYEHAD